MPCPICNGISLPGLPCVHCGGCGIAHCCEGDQAQPEQVRIAGVDPEFVLELRDGQLRDVGR
jgi:hypothetical protein